MTKTNKRLLVCLLIGAILILTAASQRPQLSFDEQTQLMDSLIQTLDPEGMKATVAAEVQEEIAAKLRYAGYDDIAAVLGTSLEILQAGGPLVQATPTPADTGTGTVAADSNTAAPATSSTAVSAGSVYGSPDKWDNPADYWEGAVLQPDGTYRGLHSKFIYAYGYGLGEDEFGQPVRSEHFIPNQRFNVDVVFENDGSVVWPPRIEMRHTNNNGEYTGHQESVISDRTHNPVKPGDRAAFTVSAHGSENLGDITFYFKLYDADSGSAIEGGDGSFFYHAVP